MIMDGLSSLEEGRLESDVIFPIETPAVLKVTTLSGACYRFIIAGKIMVVEHLNDIEDVNVPSPTDGFLLYWNAAAGKWQANKLDKTNLSQNFGPSSARLVNFIPTLIPGEALRQNRVGPSSFSAAINGAPTSTLLTYKNPTNELSIKDISSGADYWGRIILHNLTRGNSRKIVTADIDTDHITTEESDDNWADNDEITTQSQTNQQSGYFDLDLSANIGPNVIAALLFINLTSYDNNFQANRTIIIHPYETYNAGKRAYLHVYLAMECSSGMFPIPIIDQKITLRYRDFTDTVPIITIKGTYEYADA